MPVSAFTGYSVPIVAQISQLCIDAFADFCAVYLRSNGPHAAAFSARDEFYGALADIPYDDFFIERARHFGAATILEEPLMVNGRRIGALVLGMGAGNALSDVDHRMVKVLSSIVSTAVEQADELAHHYRISKRLQKAMLPAGLAKADHLAFDAAYRPAGDEADVGGDWYDAFELGNGHIGISVGDVTGHGLEAAVAMSEIRRAIRSAAASSSSPSALLNYVDNVVASQGIGMATAIVGIYDPATSALRYSCAGHPPPVLLSNHRALFLPGGGLLLGLGMESASQDWTVTLPPGASCYLYTDGLLEYGRDVIAGERDLLRALERLSLRGNPTADALHTEIFNGTINNTDDCATLALHRSESDASERSMYLAYSAVPLAAALSREALRAFVERSSDDSEERHFEILAATGEAVANAIEHGEHEPGSAFSIEVTQADGALTICVENQGHWRPFTAREERGRGVPIMRACAHNLEIASTHEKTRVTLTFST
ncbi:MAG TPA: SpoIIE family protein phosphatase [Candidatus Baltobacteraceae bacterium]|nr:SpoIIE family protein phosphatase [Candidatus Baltobacteraceae bacterium]